MATNSYLQLNISNPNLNLTKNTYQNSDFTYLESYPFDNMLQPITTHNDIGNYYNLDGSLYNLVGNNILLKDGLIIKDFADEIKSSTTEYEGKKFGNYTIDVDNSLYYSGSFKRSFTNNHQDFFYLNSALIIDDKIYEYINGVETVYDFPVDFNFNKVQVLYNNGHFVLFEKKLCMATDNSTLKSSVGVLGFTQGNLKYYKLQSDLTKIPALLAYGMSDGVQSSSYFGYIKIAEGTIQQNSIRLTVGDQKIWRSGYNIGVVEKIDTSNFYYTVFPFLTNTDSNPKPITLGTIPVYTNWYEVHAVQGFKAALNSSGEVYQTGVIHNKARYMHRSSGTITIPSSSFDSVVYYYYDEAVIYGFKYELDGSNLKYITEFSNGNCLTMPNFIDSPNPTVALEDTGALVLRNSSGRAITDEKTLMPQYDNFTAYYKEGALIYYLYKGFPISMPAAFDECYIEDKNTISIYSSTSNKTYRINFSTTNPLKVVKYGDNLFTNAVYPYYFNKYGKQDMSISFPVFDAKDNDSLYFSGYSFPTTNEYFIGGYIGFQVGNVWLSASDAQIGVDIGSNLPVLFNIKGKFDLYAGTTGTVSYVSSYNGNNKIVKEIEKEHGISESSLWQLPVTDIIRATADYDVYNSYITIQGFTVKLSVYNNEIIPAISISSIDDDIDEIFVIQGQPYMIKKDSIYAFEMSAENGIQNEQFIVSTRGLKYLGYETTQAYFFDPLTKNVLNFVGSNQLLTGISLSGLSFEKEVISWQDVEHQIFVLSTDNVSILSIADKLITLNYRINGNCCVYKDRIYLGNKYITLGTGTSHITTGWISLNDSAESPFSKFGAIYIDLLEEGDTSVTVSVLTPDREIKTDAEKQFKNKYIKFVPDTVTGLKIKLDIVTQKPIVGISLSTNPLTTQSNTIRSNLI